MTPKQIACLIAHLDARARESFAEARREMTEALNELARAVPDGEIVERTLSAAMLHVGEARGFRNAAYDVGNGEVEP